MRTFRFFLLALCAAGVTVSCMTVARQIPPSTELFDSTVDASAKQADGAGTAPSEPLLPPEAPQPALTRTAADSSSPAPVLMDVGPVPAVEDTSLSEPDEPPQVSDDAQVALEAPVAPTPRTTGLMDESLLTIPAPVGAAYSLAAPVIPSASGPAPRPPQQAPAQSAPPKPKPVAAAAALSSPAAPPAAAQIPASATPAAGITTTAPVTTAAPAPTAAGSTAAAASSTSQPSGAAAAAPANPGAGTREIYARIGDELQVGMDGTGYLFLGMPDAAPQDGMTFKGKESRDGKTWFTFKALKLGTYDLGFQRQDNTTGTSTRQAVRVHVVSDQDFASAVQGGSAADAQAGSTDVGDPAFADRLSGVGAYDAAIAELLKGYTEGNPSLNDRIASLYLRSGALDAAEKYYSKNLSPRNPYTDNAVLGMVDIAVAQRDQPQLMSLLRQLLADTAPGAEETLILSARMERDLGQVGIGLELVSEYSGRYPQGKWRDEAEFIAAQLLEAESQFRDLARARDLYQDIVTNQPESAFAGQAQDRVHYIDRHFFQVR